jgi:hypothetical protein
LFGWGATIILGGGSPAWAALWISLGIIVAAITTAWLVLRRQEL